MNDMLHETTGDLTVWDAFKIGVKVVTYNMRYVVINEKFSLPGNKCNDPGIRNPDPWRGACQSSGRRSQHADFHWRAWCQGKCEAFVILRLLIKFLKVLRNLVKTAKTVHDQKLDRWAKQNCLFSLFHTKLVRIGWTKITLLQMGRSKRGAQHEPVALQLLPCQEEEVCKEPWQKGGCYKVLPVIWFFTFSKI